MLIRILHVWHMGFLAQPWSVSPLPLQFWCWESPHQLIFQLQTLSVIVFLPLTDLIQVNNKMQHYWNICVFISMTRLHFWMSPLFTVFVMCLYYFTISVKFLCICPFDLTKVLIDKAHIPLTYFFENCAGWHKEMTELYLISTYMEVFVLPEDKDPKTCNDMLW